ncbi:MAG: holo-ACP synthase [Thermodesulfobacteriota bacterium]|nr:holo-ACP synthase [Thermodesulfobacteriota bacterium]
MICGIGTDITDIGRIDHLYKRYKDRFLQRVFCEKEIAYCRSMHDAAPHLAARFAAKEATLKALGTGVSKAIHLKDVCVINTHGAPTLELKAGAEKQARKMGVTHLHLSLSHDAGAGVAFVIMEKRQ